MDNIVVDGRNGSGVNIPDEKASNPPRDSEETSPYVVVGRDGTMESREESSRGGLSPISPSEMTRRERELERRVNDLERALEEARADAKLQDQRAAQTELVMGQEMETLVARMEEMGLKIAGFDDERSQLKGQTKESALEIKRLQAALKERDDEAATMKNQLSKFSVSADTKTIENEDLKTKVADLQNVVQDTRADAVPKLLETQRNLSMELDQLRRHDKGLRETISTLEAALDTERHRVVELRTSLAETTAEFEAVSRHPQTPNRPPSQTAPTQADPLLTKQMRWIISYCEDLVHHASLPSSSAEDIKEKINGLSANLNPLKRLVDSPHDKLHSDLPGKPPSRPPLAESPRPVAASRQMNAADAEQLFDFNQNLIAEKGQIQRRLSEMVDEKQLMEVTLRKTIDDVLKENVRLKSEFKSLARELFKLKKKFGDHQDSEKMLEDESKQNSLLESQVNSQKIHIEGIEEDRELLRNKLNEARDRVDMLSGNKDILSKRVLELERIVEELTMDKRLSQARSNASDASVCLNSNELEVLQERCEELSRDKFAFKKLSEEADSKIEEMQNHIFDLEAELREKDLQVTVMKKRELEVQVEARKISHQILKNSSGLDPLNGGMRGKFGLREVDNGVIASVLVYLFPSFFRDENQAKYV